MLSERQSYFLSHVLVHNTLLCTNLSQAMRVAKDHICKHSLELAKYGRITNNLEGTLSHSFHKGYPFFEAYSYHSKQAITSKALSLLKNGKIGIIGNNSVPEYLNCLNRVIVIEDVSKNQKIPTGP